MGASLRRVVLVEALLLVLLCGMACDKNKNGAPPDQSPADAGRPSSPVGEIMNKIGKGPQSLNNSLGQELKEDSPAWDTIQPQAKEYAQLARSLSKYDPPKGSKESWSRQADSFADSATALERATESKDKNAALAAHAQLSKSCMACHREHRAGPGGGPRNGPPRGPQP